MKLSKDTILEVKEKFGTPAYIYDEKRLLKSYQELREALPACVDIFYALKVNPNLSIVKLIRSYGGNTEVCSLGELEIAIKAGVDPKDIIFLGPYKKEKEHRRALELGIFAIVVESEDELHRLSKLAGELQKTAPVAIRINPNFSASGSPWKMGGRPTHFGIEENTAVNNFGEYAKLPNILLKGIHIYNGTKILTACSIYDNSKYILDLYETIAQRYNMTFNMVDVGGGLGIKYYENETELDTAELKNLLYPLFNEFHEKHPATRIIIESGRFVVGKSAALYVTVDSIKKNHGKTFAVTDGGTNCHSAAVGSGQVLKRNFNIINVTGSNTGGRNVYHVAGPLCNPDDLLGRDIELETVQVGDILAITASGAYGPTASPTLFHSHGYPAEIIAAHGKLILARHRDSVEDIIGAHVDVPLNQLLGADNPAQMKAGQPIVGTTQTAVATIVRTTLKLPDSKPIFADSHLRDDLGLDSLSSMEILVGLEDAVEGFFVNPDTIEPRNFNTIGTLAAYVEAERLQLMGQARSEEQYASA